MKQDKFLKFLITVFQVICIYVLLATCSNPIVEYYQYDLEKRTIALLLISPYVLGMFLHWKFPLINVVLGLLTSMIYIVSIELAHSDLITDLIINGIAIISVAIFQILFGLHPISSTQRQEIDEKILDHPTVSIAHPTIYFLRIHRIFAIVIAWIAVGIFVLSTQTGGHISVEEGGYLTGTALFILIIAWLLWKFPKVMSILLVILLSFFILFTGATLLFIFFIDHQESPWQIPLSHQQAIQENTVWLFSSSVALILSLFTLPLLLICKTARQEWKMK